MIQRGNPLKQIIAAVLAFFFGIGLCTTPAQAAIGGDNQFIVTLANDFSDSLITRRFPDSDAVWVCEETDTSCRIVKKGRYFTLMVSKKESISNAIYAYSGNGAYIEREWDGSPLPINIKFDLPSGKELKLKLVYASALITSP